MQTWKEHTNSRQKDPRPCHQTKRFVAVRQKQIYKAGTDHRHEKLMIKCAHTDTNMYFFGYPNFECQPPSSRRPGFTSLTTRSTTQDKVEWINNQKTDLTRKPTKT